MAHDNSPRVTGEDDVRKVFTISAFLLSALCAACPVRAHVPYLEKQDYSEQKPFTVSDSIENSKAIYAWFETGTDVDVYTFEVTKPVRVYAKALVQVCSAFEKLLPRLAVAGPGFPVPQEKLPFTLPDGYGAIVIKNKNPGEARETFYETFSGKTYYDGPAFDQEISTPGKWYIYYWDPYKTGGDYVAVLGFEEAFSFLDIMRALIRTPIIWFNGHLHTKC